MDGISIDPKFKNLIPPMTDEALSGLEQSLKVEGCRDALITWDGKLLDGHHRLKICRKYGIKYRTKAMKFPDRNAAEIWIILNQLNRRNVTPAQRVLLGTELEPRYAKQAKERAAEGRKRGGETAGRGRPKHDSSTAKGRQTYREPTTNQAVAKAVGVGEKTYERGKAVLESDDENTKAKMLSGEVSVSAAHSVVTGKGPHVATNTGNNEWYTPQSYADRARRVMGGIDLDPASSAEANKVIKAESFFTRTDNGLKKKWSGRVWMNPPYSQPAIAHFCEKLVNGYKAGDVNQAIVLVNNATETKWFQLLLGVAAAVCFPAGRIKFWSPGALAAPLQGQALIYCGTRKSAFCDEFSNYGKVCRVR